MTIKYEVLELLRNRPIWLTYAKIEEYTKIPTGWLTALTRGKIKQPDAQRLETLLTFLKNTLNGNTEL